MRKKVSIIGAGNVGSSAAQLLAFAGIADLTLYDIIDGVPQGKALDIAEACPLFNSSAVIEGTNSYEDTADSDIVVVTAGQARKKGMTRDDLAAANADTIRGIAVESAKSSPDAVFIIVTNPVDAMTHLFWEIAGLTHWKVVGMGGVLDSTRYRAFVAWEMGVSPADVEALVLGGHGEAMVPMPRFTTVKGASITNFLSDDQIKSLGERTRHAGDEIVSSLKIGSAYSAPGAAIFQMVKSVLLDEKRVLACSAYLEGNYGISGTFSGVPVVLGRNGVERIIELELEPQEQMDFERSVERVRAVLERLSTKF